MSEYDALIAVLRADAGQVLFENHPEVYPGAVSVRLNEAVDAIVSLQHQLAEAKEEISLMRSDLYAIGSALGISAKPYSGHEAMQRDFIPAIERLVYRSKA